MTKTLLDPRAAKLKVLPIAPMLSEAIRSVHKVRSGSSCRPKAREFAIKKFGMNRVGTLAGSTIPPWRPVENGRKH